MACWKVSTIQDTPLLPKNHKQRKCISVYRARGREGFMPWVLYGITIQSSRLTSSHQLNVQETVLGEVTGGC